MSMYKYVRDLWKQPKENLGDLWKQRLIEWRKTPSTVRIEKPTRIDRARSLGYKAKPGYIVVRQRVIRGGRHRSRPSGKRPKNMTTRKVLGMNYQWVAEQRAEKRYPNCTVLNSYYVADDGRYYWYEVILIDRTHPVILKDNSINWISLQRGRAQRGMTSAAAKSRGLLNKGKGAEKLRPSKTAVFKKKQRKTADYKIRIR